MARQIAYGWHHPANRGRRARALTTAVVARAAMAAGRTITVPLGTGSRMRVFPDVPSSIDAAVANPFDWLEMQVWARHLNEGDLFVDVGAHLGAYAVFAGDCGAEAVAIEPNPLLTGYIRENLELNHQTAEVHQVAVAEARGRTVLGGSTYCRAAIDAPEGIPVDLATLDELVGDRRVSGLKIDVEGAEHRVLLGATSLLGERRVDLIQLEWNDLAPRQATADMLDGYGYRMFAPIEGGELVPLQDGHDMPNVFAARR